MIRIVLMTIPNAARVLLATCALAGVFGVVPIVQRQIIGAAACPTLGPVPACYLVLLGYGLIVVSVFLAARYRLGIFAAGWLPLFILASAGSGLELLGQVACPRSSTGIPACFLSLGLLSLIVVFYVVEKRLAPGRESW